MTYKWPIRGGLQVERIDRGKLRVGRAWTMRDSEGLAGLECRILEGDWKEMEAGVPGKTKSLGRRSFFFYFISKKVWFCPKSKGMSAFSEVTRDLCVTKHHAACCVNEWAAGRYRFESSI